jgi:hypothetical protein
MGIWLLNSIRPISLIFNNMAQIAIELKQYLNCISYVSAVSRVNYGYKRIPDSENSSNIVTAIRNVDGKAKFRLAKSLLSLDEPKFVKDNSKLFQVQDQGEATKNPSEPTKALNNLFQRNQKVFSSGNLVELEQLCADKDYICNDWTHPAIEMKFISENKGRGIITNWFIPMGTVLIVQTREFVAKEGEDYAFEFGNKL